MRGENYKTLKRHLSIFPASEPTSLRLRRLSRMGNRMENRIKHVNSHHSSTMSVESVGAEEIFFLLDAINFEGSESILTAAWREDAWRVHPARSIRADDTADRWLAWLGAR